MQKMKMSQCVLLALIMLSVTALAGAPSAGTWPTKAIEYVSPFAPGGGNDSAARVLAKHLSREFKVPVNVTNKPGGNQIPAVMYVLNSPPDGYTLINDAQSTTSLHGLLKDLPYKMEDRVFGPMIASGPIVFIVNSKSPWKSLKDVAEAARKDPASFTWARLGGTSITDFAVLQFLMEAGVDVAKTKPVLYQGAGPAATAVAGGHVMFAGGGASGSVLSLTKSGDLKPLGVTGARRVSGLPDVPSTKEAGFPGSTLFAWYAMSGPKNLPQTVVEKLDITVKKLSGMAEYVKDMGAVGNEPSYVSSAEMRDLIKREIDTFKSLSEKLAAMK
jgi:tripartite-type tricarboxylate transporter receptor subunit TctC